jgi:hypothetical protein
LEEVVQAAERRRKEKQAGEAEKMLTYEKLLERSFIIDQGLLAHLSPLKWEHINLTGDYHWRRDGGLRNRKLRPLRSQPLSTGFAP